MYYEYITSVKLILALIFHITRADIGWHNGSGGRSGGEARERADVSFLGIVSGPSLSGTSSGLWPCMAAARAFTRQEKAVLSPSLAFLIAPQNNFYDPKIIGVGNDR